MAGKGSKRRPTDEKKYADGWERVFWKKVNNKNKVKK